MATNDLRSLLTPAAREMMGELVRDFGDRLLLGAADAATRAGTGLREISVADLAQAFSRLQPDSGRLRRSLVDRVLEMYTALGIIVGLVGFAAMIVGRYLGRQIFESESIALAVAATGFLLVVFSFLVRRSRVAGRVFASAGTVGFEPRLLDTASFIRSWSEIELALRELASIKVGESTAQRPISEIIDLLYHSGAVAAEDLDTIRRLLRVRNSVVHGQSEIDPRRLGEAVADSRQVLHRLSAAVVT